MCKIILGFDLGSNSIGWALLKADSNNKIIDIINVGTRIFSKAVEEGKPIPKNAKRRNCRLARRTTQRRARRKKKLLNYLISLNLLPKALLDSAQPEGILNSLGDPYVLRAKALDDVLTAHELGRVFLHLVQRRGFLSNKKTLLGRDMWDDPDVLAVLSDEDTHENDTAEESAFKEEINRLRETINKQGYRTLGEYLVSRPLHECKRNRFGQHIRTDRQMYSDELSLIFKHQAPHHSTLTKEVQSHIEHIIFHQRPLKLKKDRVGKCSLEPNKKRAAIARLEYQRFRYYQDINTLAYFDPNSEQKIPLCDEDRKKLVNAFETTASLSFTKLRKILGLDKNCLFNLETDNKKLRGNTTAVSVQNIFPAWDGLDNKRQHQLIEDLLSIQKKSTLKHRLVNHWKIDGETAIRLCMMELEPGYGNVSLKAINNLLPHMQQGAIYSDARIAAGYGYEKQAITPLDKLGSPPELPNPIVQKALYELRRVTNTIIAEYGKPDIIRIEMARDLEMNTKRYKAFKTQQEKNRKANEKATEAYQQIREEHPQLQLSLYPSRDQKLRYRLWQDQQHRCIYSGKTINLKTLFSADIEIDHILPFSQSLDDSYMNKVVCLAAENRIKGQNTPVDAFGNNTDKWEQITQAISRWPQNIAKKRDRFYMKEHDLLNSDFINNQLSDTRYICKEAGSYLKTLGVDVTFTRGIITDWLRHQWQLNTLINNKLEKDRTDHRHHAIDAAVTACIDRSLYNRIITISKRLERSGSQLNMKNILIEPPLPDIREKLSTKLHKMIVSHVPRRKITGELHEKTGVGFIEGIGTVYRLWLNKDFTAKKADSIIDPEVKSLVKAHLERHQNNAKEAFSSGFTLLHKEGKTLIKRVRVVQSKVTKNKLNDKKFAIEDKQGKPFKWHAYGNTHHVEIIYNNQSKKYSGKFITAMEAAQRCRQRNQHRQPIIQTQHAGQNQFVMALHRNELVSLSIDNNPVIYRVQKLNMVDSIISLRLHTAATDNNSNEGIAKSANTLMQTYQMKKLSVNAIGKLIDDQTHN